MRSEGSSSRERASLGRNDSLVRVQTPHAAGDRYAEKEDVLEDKGRKVVQRRRLHQKRQRGF